MVVYLLLFNGREADEDEENDNDCCDGGDKLSDNGGGDGPS